MFCQTFVLSNFLFSDIFLICGLSCSGGACSVCHFAHTLQQNTRQFFSTSVAKTQSFTSLHFTAQQGQICTTDQVRRWHQRCSVEFVREDNFTLQKKPGCTRGYTLMNAGQEIKNPVTQLHRHVDTLFMLDVPGLFI